MSTNRIVRIVVGLALIGYGLYEHNIWFGLVGLAPLATGLINWCPLEMKMGTCDPASGCCATPTSSKSSSDCSTPEDTNSSCCSTPTPQAAWSTTKQECCGDDTIKIEVLGTGCKKCKLLEEAAQEAVKDLEGEYCVIKVEDVQKIMAYGVTATPALVINGEVKSTGRVLEVQEIQALLQ